MNEITIQQGIKFSEVISELPNSIKETAQKYGEVSFTLFKATMSKNSVKLLPHGHLRTPYLINDVMLSHLIVKDLAIRTGTPETEVEGILKQLTLKAKRSLEKGVPFRIDGLCRVYVDAGKIRVSAFR